MGCDSPVFLVGSERSGTTLLRLMLDQHPDIAFNLESEFLVTQISDDGEFPDIGSYLEFLRNDRVFQHSDFVIKDNLDYVSLVKDFLEQKRIRDGKAIVGATIHHQFRRISRIWPTAKYIYIFRDGRDVANSIVGMGWAGNAYIAADWWLEAESEWERCRQIIPDGSWIEVRYEEIIAKPREQLNRICQFLGVDYSDRIFDYVGRSSYVMPDVALNYKWKRTMGKKDVQRLESKIGDRLQSRGYELSGYPSITLSSIGKLGLAWHSRVGTLVYRIRMYGAILVIREMIARRFGLKGQHKRLRQMIDSVIDANLK